MADNNLLNTTDTIIYEQNLVKVKNLVNETNIGDTSSIEYPEVYVRPGENIDLKTFTSNIKELKVDENDIIMEFEDGQSIRFISMVLVGLENPDLTLLMPNEDLKFQDLMETISKPISKVAKDAIYTNEEVIVKQNVVIADKETEVVDTSGAKEEENLITDEFYEINDNTGISDIIMEEVEVSEVVDPLPYDVPPPNNPSTIIEDNSSKDLSKTTADVEGVKPKLEFEIDFMHVYQSIQTNGNTMEVTGGGGTTYQNAYPAEVPLAEQVKQTDIETLNYSYYVNTDYSDTKITLDKQDLFTETEVSRIMEITPTQPPAFELTEFIVTGLPEGVRILNGEETEPGVWLINISTPIELPENETINAPYNENLDGFYTNTENETIELIMVYDRDTRETFEMNVYGKTVYNPDLVTDELREAGFQEPVETELTFDKWYGVTIKEVNPENLTSYLFEPFEGEEDVYENGFVLSTNLNENIVYGTHGNNEIEGSITRDYIKTYEGNDIINAGKGDDIITAGDGNDHIDGGDNSLEYEYGKTWTYGSDNDLMIGDTIHFEDFLSNIVTPNEGVEVNLEQGYIKGQGNDTITNVENIIGTDYNDYLRGNLSDNIILGGNYSDIIYGMDGNDKLYGETGNDTISGGEGNDIIYGGDGQDTISFQEAKQGIKVELQTQEATELGKEEGKSWGEGEDYLYQIENVIGSNFDDYITGNISNNVIDGGAGSDTVDFSILKNTKVYVDLTEGYSTGDGMDLLYNMENVLGTNHILGDDTLIGNSSANNLQGLMGKDILDGKSGDDYIDGGKGDDFIYADMGNDDYVGGEGTDIISFENVNTGIEVDLSKETKQNTNVGNDSFKGIENVKGSIYDDIISGTTGVNEIDGNYGIDIVNYSYSDNEIIANLSSKDYNDGIYQAEAYTVNELKAIDQIKNIEGVRGSNYNDFIIGSVSDNIIEGGEGNDIVITSTGDDTIDGGAGNDTLNYSNSSEKIIVENLNNSVYSDVVKTIETKDVVKNIEKIIGTDYDDTIKADLSDNTNITFESGKGDDTLRGGAGNDILKGETGNDTFIVSNGEDYINGGDNFDTMDYSSLNSGILINFNTTEGYSAIITEDQPIIKDTLVNIEKLISTNYDDIIKGGAGINNEIITLDGDDTIFENYGTNIVDGGEGSDTVSYEILNSNINIDLSKNIIQNIYSFNGDDIITKYINIENVVGTNYNDIIKGNELDNTLSGGEGNDEIHSSTGINKLNGDSGDDTFKVLNGNDIIDGGNEIDTIDFSKITNEEGILEGISINLSNKNSQDTNAGMKTIENVENILGTIYQDLIKGDNKDNILDGNYGIDTVSYENENIGIILNLDNENITLINSDNDEIIYQAQTTDLVTNKDTLLNIENIIGSNFNDFIILDKKENEVKTLEGNDEILSNKGNKNIDGGLGEDLINYELLNTQINLEGYTVNQETEVNKGSLGVDTVINVENLKGSNFNDTIRFSQTEEVSNKIYGNDGDDILNGGAGNDYLYGEEGNDNFELELGNDYLDGGNGIDTVDYSTSNEELFLDMNENTIFSEVKLNNVLEDYIINIENIKTTNQNDTIYANELDNKIETLGGDDTIFEGFGDNIVDGGEGQDTMDYSKLTDKINVDLLNKGLQEIYNNGIDIINTKYMNIENIIGTDYNDTIKGNELNNTLSGGSGNDTIEGAEGNNILNGESGNDIISAGDGNNIIDGGLGNDIISAGDGSNEVNTSAGTNVITLGDGGNIINVETSDNTISTGAGNDTFNIKSGNQTISDGAGNDTINGGDGVETILLGYGTDVIDGGSNVDILDLSKYNIGLTIDLSIETSQEIGIGEKQIKNIESIIGGNGDDLFFTSKTEDNYIDGNYGNDTVDYSNQDNSVYVNLSNEILTTSNNNVVMANTTNKGFAKDYLTSIENINGSNYDDEILGSEETNKINGGLGSDILYYSKGSDILDGGDGQDIVSYLTSSMGILVNNFNTSLNYENEVIIGSDKDTVKNIENMIGSNFNDDISFDNSDVSDNYIYSMDGDDIISSGAGNDVINMGKGNDIFNYSSGVNYIDGGDNSDTIDYSIASNAIYVDLVDNGLDTIIYENLIGKDTVKNIENIIGTDYNDTIYGNNQDNVLKGGLGNDTIFEDYGTNEVDGGNGIDTLDYSQFTDGGIKVDLNNKMQQIIYSSNGNEIISKITNMENVNGTDNDDEITGNELDNVVNGNYGVDVLKGYKGNDTLNGGFGDDFLVGGEGDDILNGGDGIDVASYRDSIEDLTINITDGTVKISDFEGWDTFNSIEGAEGGAGNDTIYGNSGENALYGNEGNDILLSNGVFDENGNVAAGYDLVDGGGGIDFVSFDFTSNSITLDLGIIAIQDTIGAGQILIKNIENLEGGKGNDYLYGNGYDNEINGNLGDDVISGGAGNDILNGEEGNDTLTYITNEIAGVDIDMNQVNGEVLNDGQGYVDDISNFETIIGSNLKDKFKGNDGVDVFYGKNDNDIIYNSNGDDQLFGELGDDTLKITNGFTSNGMFDGGFDSDTISFEEYENVGITLTLGIGVTSIIDENSNKIIDIQNVENITGSNQNDTFKGNELDNVIKGLDGQDTLKGSGGTDILDGGLGVDTLDLSDIQNKVTASLTSKVLMDTEINGELGQNDTILNIENIIGTNYDDILELDSGENKVDGKGGINTLTYENYAYAVNVNLSDNTLQTVASGLDLEGNTWYDKDEITNITNLNGSKYGDVLIGNNVDNIILGNAGDDTLNGGAGQDTLEGGLGNDTIQYDSGNDTIKGGEGSDTIDYSNFVRDITDTNINGMNVDLKTNQVIVTDSNTNTYIDELNSVENIVGTDYNDLIQLNTENNKVDGGAGIDTLTFAQSGNGVIVDLSNTEIQNTLEGNDTISNVENIIGSDYGDIFTGNSSENLIEAGSGDDIIYGNENNDILKGQNDNDTIYDSLGNDIIEGGLGNDYIYLRNNIISGTYEDLVINEVDSVDGGIGNDTIDYSYSDKGIKLNLNSNILSDVKEYTTNIIIDSIKNVENVVGSNFDDEISGDLMDNEISTLNGDDIIFGSKGNDTLNAGFGTDTISYENAENGVEVSLKISTGKDLGTGNYVGNDTLTNFENIIGSDFDDVLEGNMKTNIIDGGTNGVDTISFFNYSYNVQFDLRETDFQNVNTNYVEDTYKIISIENFTGSNYDDNLILGNGINIVDMGIGYDYITSMSKTDGTDTINGGDGVDTMDYSNFTNSAIKVTLNGNLLATVDVLNGDNDKLQNIENIIGTTGNDEITGDIFSNIIYGGDGDDILDGGVGDDFIYGGAGDDSVSGGMDDDYIDGGDDTDTIDYSAKGSPVYVDFTDETTKITNNGLEYTKALFASETDYLRGIENIIGTAGNDFIGGDNSNNIIEGKEGNDEINGNLGDDTLKGDGGDDTFYVSQMEDGNDIIEGGTGTNTLSFETITTALDGNTKGIEITFNVATQPDGYLHIEMSDLQDSNVEIDKIKEIQNFVGTKFDDIIIGTSGDNKIEGGFGNDILDGAAGADILDGGEGIDTVSYDFTSESATINLHLQQGNIGAEFDQLISIENVIGGKGNDVIYMKDDGSENVVDGNDGDLDKISYINYTQSVNLDLEAMKLDKVSLTPAGTDKDQIINIEQYETTNFNDTVVGSSAAEFIYTLLGDDYVDGGLGDDYIETGVGLDTIVISSNSGSDTVNAGDGNDTFVIYYDNATSIDTLDGQNDLDTVDYSNLSNEYSVNITLKESLITEGAITDLNTNEMIVDYIKNVEYVTGSQGNDVIVGDAKNNILKGESGVDAIDGGLGNDIVYGGDDNDVLSGGLGDDIIYGEAGNDTLYSDGGTDTYNGGEGFDTLSFNNSLLGITIDLSKGSQIIAGQDLTTIVSIEKFVGSMNDDIFLIDYQNPNEVDGGVGVDTISYQNLNEDTNNLGFNYQNEVFTNDATKDYILVNMSSNTITIKDALGNDVVLESNNSQTYYNGIAQYGAVKDVFSSIEKVIGTYGNDYIKGSDNNDIIEGGAGDDFLDGALGDDIIYGGTGSDSVDFSTVTENMNINLTTGITTGQGNDLLYSIENVVGGQNNDTIVGNSEDNKIDGFTGVDKLDYSTIDFGGENENGINVQLDIVNAEGYGLVTEKDLAINVIGTDLVKNIEEIIGTTSKDFMKGSNDNTTLETMNGFTGNDTLYMSKGLDNLNGDLDNDTLDLSELNNDNLYVNFELNGSDYSNIISVYNNLDELQEDYQTRVKNIENVIGTSGNDTIKGDLNNNTINGEIGNDVINGGDGADTIHGGEGNDILSGDGGNDTINGDIGDDFIYGGEGQDIINGGIGDDYIKGGTSNDEIYGNEGNDIISGDSGNDIIDGGIGINTLNYFDGLTSLNINLFETMIDDTNTVLDESLYYKAESLLESDQGVDYFRNINNIIASNVANDTIITGNNSIILTLGGNDTITLKGINNDVNLGIGDDIVINEDPINNTNNFIYGGEGVDTIDYSNSTNGIYIDFTTSDTIDKSFTILGNTDNETLNNQLETNILQGDIYKTYFFTNNDMDTLNITEIDKLASVERIVGSDFNDVVVDGNEDNVYELGLGLDTIYGGFGNNTIIDSELEINTLTYETLSNLYFVEMDLLNGNIYIKDNTTSEILGTTSVEGIRKYIGSDNDDLIINDEYIDNYNQIIYGGSGVDTISHSKYNSSVVVDLSNNSVVSDTMNGSEIDSIYEIENVIGSEGNDTIIGDDLDNVLSGIKGDDTIDGGLGDDTIDGGFGEDKIIANLGDDTIDGGDDYDTLTYTNFTDIIGMIDYYINTDLTTLNLINIYDNLNTLQKTDTIINMEKINLTKNNDTIIGGQNVDIYAGQGDDIITAANNATSDNEYYGEAGNDTLYSGIGKDLLDGGLGDDLFRANKGYDIINGGDGIDTINYDNLNNYISINLGSGIASGDDIDVDVVTNIETVIGTDHEDTIIGDTKTNNLYGGEGNDTISGGLGIDYLYGEGGLDTFIVNYQEIEENPLNATDNDFIYGGLGDDTIDYSSIDNSAGNLAKTLYIDTTSSYTSNIIRIYSEEDGEVYKVDTFEDIEIIRATQNNDIITQVVGITIYGEGGDDIIKSGEGVINAEIYGGNGDDTFYGSAGQDTIYGEGGNDLFIAYDPNDYANTIGSNDYFDGGTDIDTISYELVQNAIAVNLLNNTASGIDIDTDTLIGFENVIGGQNSDNIIGNTLDNEITGNAGNDTIDGDAGNDTIYGGIGNDTIDGGSGDDYIEGNEGDDIIDGNTGDDTIYGGIGNDTIDGGSGDDYIEGNEGDDIIDGGSGVDTIIAGVGNDIIYSSGEGNDTIDMGSGDDYYELTDSDIYVGSVAKTNTIVGGELNEVLGDEINYNKIINYFAAVYTDRIEFRTIGSDPYLGTTYHTDYYSEIENILLTENNDYLFEQVTSDIVIVDAGGGVDTIDFSNYTSDQVVNINTGQYVNFENVIGGAGNDVIENNNANNDLVGGDGDDWFIINGSGIDNVDGGNHINGDTLDFINLISGITIDISGSSMTYTSATGSGTLNYVNIEWVQGTNFNDTITNSTSSNTIWGIDGDDTINLIYGGQDTVYGGNGDDYINVKSVDNIIDGGDESIKTIIDLTPIELIPFIRGDILEFDMAGSYANGDSINFGGNVLSTYTFNANVNSNEMEVSDSNGNLIGIQTLSNIENITFSNGNDKYYDYFDGSNTGSIDKRRVINSGEGNDDIRLNNNLQTYITLGNGDDIYTNDGLGNDIVIGGSSIGTDGGDIILTKSGNDIVAGGTGSDIISTGAGDDWVELSVNGSSSSIWDNASTNGYQTDKEAAEMEINYTGLKYWDGTTVTTLDNITEDHLFAGTGSDIVSLASANSEDSMTSSFVWNNYLNIDLSKNYYEIYSYDISGNSSIAALGHIFDFEVAIGQDIDVYSGIGQDIMSGYSQFNKEQGDILRSSDDGNILVGLRGNDTFYGGAGSDIIFGLDTSNSVNYDIFEVSGVIKEDDDVFILEKEQIDRAGGIVNTDEIYLGTGTDRIVLGVAADLGTYHVEIDFNTNPDLIQIYDGTTLVWDAIVDTNTEFYNLGNNNDIYIDYDLDIGYRHVAGHGGDDIIYGMAGIDNIHGGADNDYIEGGAGDDELFGAGPYVFATDSLETNEIYGGIGNDLIYGAGGYDLIDAGNDNDIVVYSLGGDNIDGGLGEDTFVLGVDWLDVQYAQTSTMDLRNNQVITNGGEITIINNFENLTGGYGDDIIYGDANNNKLDGAEGTDNITFESYTTISGGTSTNIGLIATTTSEGIDTISNFEDYNFIAGGEFDITNVSGTNITIDFFNVDGTLIGQANGIDLYTDSSGKGITSYTGTTNNDEIHFSLLSTGGDINTYSGNDVIGVAGDLWNIDLGAGTDTLIVRQESGVIQLNSDFDIINTQHTVIGIEKYIFEDTTGSLSIGGSDYQTLSSKSFIFQFGEGSDTMTIDKDLGSAGGHHIDGGAGSDTLYLNYDLVNSGSVLISGFETVYINAEQTGNITIDAGTNIITQSIETLDPGGINIGTQSFEVGTTAISGTKIITEASYLKSGTIKNFDRLDLNGITINQANDTDTSTFDSILTTFSGMNILELSGGTVYDSAMSAKFSTSQVTGVSVAKGYSLSEIGTAGTAYVHGTISGSTTSSLFDGIGTVITDGTVGTITWVNKNVTEWSDGSYGGTTTDTHTGTSCDKDGNCSDWESEVTHDIYTYTAVAYENVDYTGPGTYGTYTTSYTTAHSTTYSYNTSENITLLEQSWT